MQAWSINQFYVKIDLVLYLYVAFYTLIINSIVLTIMGFRKENVWKLFYEMRCLRGEIGR
jgi:hypothetical protein